MVILVSYLRRHRVDEWVKQLDLFGRTLDEWLTCQRNWLYLEVNKFEAILENGSP